MERRRNSPLRRAQAAFLWLLLGGALGWAFTWMPGRQAGVAAPGSPLPRVPAGSLKGRRIVLASQLAYPPGHGGPSLASWLKTVLEEAGALVESPDAFADGNSPPADLIIRLESAPGKGRAPLVSCPQGDSAATRAAACLSAQLAVDLREPIQAPLHSRSLRGEAQEIPEVSLMVRANGEGELQASRIATAVGRALARHFGSPTAAGADAPESRR